MSNLLTNLLNPQNTDKRKLYKHLSILFVVFVVIGIGVGMVAGNFVEKDVSEETPNEEINENEDFYEGTVTYIEPFLFPEDNISFALIDSLGNEIILLKAKDQKLEVAEGHFVTVYGTERSTTNKKDKYLLVDRVIINNATD